MLSADSNLTELFEMAVPTLAVFIGTSESGERKVVVRIDTEHEHETVPESQKIT